MLLTSYVCEMDISSAKKAFISNDNENLVLDLVKCSLCRRGYYVDDVKMDKFAIVRTAMPELITSIEQFIEKVTLCIPHPQIVKLTAIDNLVNVKLTSGGEL